MEFVVTIMVAISIFFALFYYLTKAGRKVRKQELSGWIEPLGFEIVETIEEQDLAEYYRHRSTLGLRMNVRAVCIADTGATRSVVIEYRAGRHSYVQYYLGIHSQISAPRLVIKKRTPSTQAIFTACWEDLLFQVRFAEDPEFDKRFIVRGDPDEVRAFLNPLRRRALCESIAVPTHFSVCSKSVLVTYPNTIDVESFEHNLSQCLAMMKIISEDYEQAGSSDRNR